MLRTLLVIAMCWSGVAAAAPAAGDVTLAEERFQTGRRLYKEGRFADALDAFRQAQAQVASPNVRLYIARCELALGDPVDAYDDLVITQREAASLQAAEPKYAPTAQAAALEAADLEKKLARVKVVLSGAPDDARVRVAGREVSRASLSAPLHVVPGKVTIEVEAPGHARIAQTVTIAAGQSEGVRIELQPLPPEPPAQAAAPKSESVESASQVASQVASREPEAQPGRHAPTWATVGTWSGLGLGVAGAGAFGVLYVQADAQHQALVDECVDKACSPERSSSLRSTGRTLQTWTNVALVTSAAGFAIGAGSYLLGRAFPAMDPVALGTDGHTLYVAGRF